MLIMRHIKAPVVGVQLLAEFCDCAFFFAFCQVSTAELPSPAQLATTGRSSEEGEKAQSSAGLPLFHQHSSLAQNTQSHFLE